MAGRQGLEPRYADPESAVLPLDDLPDTIDSNTSRSGREPPPHGGVEIYLGDIRSLWYAFVSAKVFCGWLGKHWLVVGKGFLCGQIRLGMYAFSRWRWFAPPCARNFL